MHYGRQIPVNQHGFTKIPCIMTNMHYDVMHYEQVNCNNFLKVAGATSTVMSINLTIYNETALIMME